MTLLLLLQLSEKAAAAVDAADKAKLETTLTRLVGFGTRDTFSDTESDVRGIGAARRWIKKEFESIEGLHVEFHPFTARSRRTGEEREALNVFAIHKGKTRPMEAVVFGAHYDSLNLKGGPDDDAPGADDDGSGTAAVIEAARILARHEFERTIIFCCFAGEEQGLLGSRALAKEIKALGFEVVGMLNNDIIASPGESCRIFADATSRPMMRRAKLVGNAAAPDFEILLQARADRPGRGGDQQPFQAEGIPAIRLMSTHENLEAQHTADDTIDKISFDDMLRIFKIDVALLATLADAPPAPAGLRVEAVDGGVRVDWTPQKDADGYRVAIRHGRNLDFSKVVEAKPGDTIPLDVEEGVSVSVAAMRGGALGSFSAEAEP